MSEKMMAASTAKRASGCSVVCAANAASSQRAKKSVLAPPSGPGVWYSGR
jgi:hypothetical protein